MQLKLLFPFRFILFYKIFEKSVYEELLTRDVNWIQPLIGKRTFLSLFSVALCPKGAGPLYTCVRHIQESKLFGRNFTDFFFKEKKKKGEQPSFRGAVFGHLCLGVSSTLSTSLPVLTLLIISVCSQFCWHNSAPLCLSRYRFLSAESVTALGHDTVSSSENNRLCPRCTHTWSVYIFIPQREKIRLSSPCFPLPLQVFSSLTHGFPLMQEFLLRLSQDGRRLRGLGGRAEACARRIIRGERHTLMVESSLADSSSSWSAGLNATEFTTSSCARRARQML